MPINTIAVSDPDDKSPSQKRRTAAYQSIAGSVCVLVATLQEDLRGAAITVYVDNEGVRAGIVRKIIQRADRSQRRFY